MLFVNAIDLNKNELKNPLLQNLAAAPSSPVKGQFYFDTVLGHAYVYDGAVWQQASGGSNGDFSSNTATSVDSEIVLFSGTNGKTGKRATGTGVAKITSGVLGTATAGTDYAPATSGGAALKGNGAGGFSTATLNDVGAATADYSLNSHKITNLLDPTAAQDAATKNYVDITAQGLDPKPGATVATTAALPALTYANGTSGVGATLTASANGALTVDGYAVAAGDIVLVKNQASGLQNGLYDVTQPGTGGTPFILTRNPSMDTAAEFRAAYIVVEDAGTANANSFWVCTNSADPVVGTTAITFSQLNGATQLLAGNMIVITGNTVAVKASTAAERSTSGLTGSYTALIGDGSTTAIAITQATHGLRSDGKMHAQCFDASTGAMTMPDVTINNANGTVTFTFAVAPASNAYRIVLVG